MRAPTNSRPQTRETRDSRVTYESTFLTDDLELDDDDLHHTLSGVVRLARRNSHIVELLLYLIFLGLFTTVALLAHPGESLLQHNTALRNAVSDQEIFWNQSQIRKAYHDVDSVTEFWDWILGPFIHTILAPGFPNEPGFFYPYFRILGLVRARQLRVQQDSCSVPAELAEEISSCIAEYSRAIEETSSYGPEGAWKWQSETEAKEGTYVGRSGVSFAGSGFIHTLPLELKKAALKLQHLRDNRWIDVQTRAVFIDLMVYNANLNLLSLVKIATEFPASGGLKTFVAIRTAPVSFLLPTEGSSVMFVAECMILAQTVLYIAVELWRAKSQRWMYLTNVWHYLDWLNYVSFLAAFTLRLLPLRHVGASGFPPQPDEFINYETPLWMVTQWRNVIALNAVLTWLRLFKYAKSVPFMALLVRTLSQAAGQTLAFCSMLAVVYLGFALAHHVAFGADLWAFRTLLATMFALYRALLTADFFDEMYAANRVLGPLLFFAWTLLGFLVLLHMFVALLNEAIVLARIDVPRASVAASIHSAVAASRTALSDVLHHSHARWALHKLNYRSQQLPAEHLRTPAQQLLADALDLQRSKLEEELAAQPHPTRNRTAESDGDPGRGGQAAQLESGDGTGKAAPRRGEEGREEGEEAVSRRLGKMEVRLFRALQALKSLHAHREQASHVESRATTPGSPLRASTGRASFNLRRPQATGPSPTTRAMVDVASPRGALVTGTRKR